MKKVICDVCGEESNLNNSLFSSTRQIAIGKYNTPITVRLEVNPSMLTTDICNDCAVIAAHSVTASLMGEKNDAL